MINDCNMRPIHLIEVTDTDTFKTELCVLVVTQARVHRLICKHDGRG